MHTVGIFQYQIFSQLFDFPFILDPGSKVLKNRREGTVQEERKELYKKYGRKEGRKEGRADGWTDGRTEESFSVPFCPVPLLPFVSFLHNCLPCTRQLTFLFNPFLDVSLLSLLTEYFILKYT
jgi:hypothetical protein